MKAKELRLKPENELNTLLIEKQNQRGLLKFDFSNKSKDTSVIKKLRKEIARIKTILNSKKK